MIKLTTVKTLQTEYEGVDEFPLLQQIDPEVFDVVVLAIYEKGSRKVLGYATVIPNGEELNITHIEMKDPSLGPELLIYTLNLATVFGMTEVRLTQPTREAKELVDSIGSDQITWEE